MSLSQNTVFMFQTMKCSPEIKKNAAKSDIFLIFLQDCDVKVHT